MTPRLFALDQGFPQPIVEALSDYLEDEAQLVPVLTIDERLAELEDWELLLALHHHAEPWDGLITTDSGMVAQPRELAVTMQAKLSLVVVLEAGHDPVKATGILLAQLSGVCRRTDPLYGQVWKLRTVEKRPENPWDELAGVAKARGQPVSELWRDEQLTTDELAADPLG